MDAQEGANKGDDGTTANANNIPDAKGKAPMDDGGADEARPKKPSMKPGPNSDDDRWKLYVVYPQYGAFVVHEGVAFVAYRFLVAGVGRVGFMSITMPAEIRKFVRMLAMLP